MSETNGVVKRSFSLKRKEIEFDLEDKDGIARPHILHELVGGDRDRFLENMNKRVVLDKDGTPTGVRDVVGINAFLLSLCVCDPSGKHFSVPEIQQWPAGMQDELAKMANDLSGLGAKAKEEAKNV